MNPSIPWCRFGRNCEFLVLALALAGCATGVSGGGETPQKSLVDASMQTASERSDAEASADAWIGDGGSENTGAGRSDGAPQPEPSANTVEAGTSGPAVSATVEAGTPPPSCTGTSAVQLSYLTGTTGSVVGGSEVMWENGAHFFLIAGDCTFYAQVGQWGPTTSGKLTEEAFAALLERLRIEELLATPIYCFSRHDAPQQRIEYRERSSVRQTCNGPDGGSLAAVFDDVFAVAGELHQQGTPVGGKVRFTLLHRSENVDREDSAYTDGAPWPFGDPLDYSDPAEAEDVLIVRVHEAEGEQADALRELRRVAVNNDPYRQFIPIVQPDGGRFQLFMRDSLPEYEDEHGVLVP